MAEVCRNQYCHKITKNYKDILQPTADNLRVDSQSNAKINSLVLGPNVRT